MEISRLYIADSCTVVQNEQVIKLTNLSSATAFYNDHL